MSGSSKTSPNSSSFSQDPASLITCSSLEHYTTPGFTFFFKCNFLLVLFNEVLVSTVIHFHPCTIALLLPLRSRMFFLSSFHTFNTLLSTCMHTWDLVKFSRWFIWKSVWYTNLASVLVYVFACLFYKSCSLPEPGTIILQMPLWPIFGTLLHAGCWFARLMSENSALACVLSDNEGQEGRQSLWMSTLTTRHRGE